jgi:hypothetical protein
MRIHGQTSGNEVAYAGLVKRRGNGSEAVQFHQ